jgi:hypothetical protein
MQRLLLFGACLVTFLAGTLSAPAFEVKDRAKAPPGWWDSTAPMAIPPEYFDRVLSAYGLTLVDASKAPPTYARKVDNRVVWETAPRTYTPQEMDQILSAYGATLADASKAPPTYARTVDGKPQFENAPIAWSPQVINAILAAYR